MMDLSTNTNNNMATNHASSLQEEDSTHSQGGAYFGQTILAVHSKDVKFPQHVASDNEAIMSDSSGWHTDVSASEATSCLFDSSEMESDYFAESATESLEASLLQTTTVIKTKKVKKSKSTDQKTTSTTINNKKKKPKKRVLPPKRASKTETVKTEVTETTATTFTSADSLMAVVVHSQANTDNEKIKTTKIRKSKSSPTSSSTKSKSSSATTLDKKRARRRKIAQQKQAEATMTDDSLFSHDLQQNNTQISSQTKKNALPTGKDESHQQQEQQEQHDNHHFNPSRLRRGWSMEDFSASSSNLDTDYDYDTNVDTSQQDDNARRRRKRRGKKKTVIGKPSATDNSAATTTTTTKKKVVKKKKPVAPTKTSNATSTKVLSTPKSPSLTGAASILRELIDAEVHKESPTANSHGKDDEEESLMLLPSFHESLAPSAHNPSSFLSPTTTSLAALAKDPYHLPSSSSNTPDDDTIRQLSLEHSLTSMEKEASLDVAKHGTGGVRQYYSDSNTAAAMRNRRPISIADDKLLLLHPPAKTKRRSTLQHTNSTPARRTSDSKGHGTNVKRRQSHDGVVMADASAASQRSKRGVRRTKSHDSTGVVRRNRSRSRSQRNGRSNGNGADTTKIMPRDRSRSRSQRKGRSNGNGTDGTEPLPRNRSRSRSQRMSGSTANATSQPNTVNNRPRRSQSINLAVASQPMVKNAKRRRRPLPTESPGGTSRVSLATRTSINTMEQSVQSMPLNVPRGGGSDNGFFSCTRRTPIDKVATPSATINQPTDTTKPITNTKANVKRTSSSSKSATGNTTKKKKRASGSRPKQTSKVSSKNKKSLAALGAMPVSAGTSVATGHIASDSTGRNNVQLVQSATAANPKQKRENLISPFSVRSSDTKSFEDVSSNQSEASTIISGGTLATDAKALDLSLSSKSTVSKGIAQALASKPTNTNTNTQPKKQQQPASTTAIGSYFERESNSSHDVFAQGPKSRNAHDSISNSLEGSLLSDFSKSSGGTRKSKKSATNSSIASWSTASMRKKTISPFSSHAGFASSHTQATSLLATEHSNATSTPLIPDSDEENSDDDDNHKSFSGSIPGPMSSAVDSPPATPKEEKKQGVAMKEALKAKKASVRKVVPKKETSAKAIAGEKSAATSVAPRKAAEGNVLNESTPKPVAQKAEAKEASSKTTPVFSATSKDATAKASTTKTPLAKKHSVKITPPITNGVPPAGKKSLSNKNVDGKTPQKPIVEDFVDPVLKKAPNPKPKTSVWDSLCCRSAHAVAS